MAKQKLCYDCGRKLYQNTVCTKLFNTDNPSLMYTFHKQCAEKVLREEPSTWKRRSE